MASGEAQLSVYSTVCHLARSFDVGCAVGSESSRQSRAVDEDMFNYSQTHSHDVEFVQLERPLPGPSFNNAFPFN